MTLNACSLSFSCVLLVTCYILPCPRMTSCSLPDHLHRYPCAIPWIGRHFNAPHHRKLLIIGESHYLPDGSTVHHKPSDWYASDESALTEEERHWTCTAGVVAEAIGNDYLYPGHRMYRNLAYELEPFGVHLARQGTPMEHCLFYNYFQRPAEEEGDSINVCEQDEKVAAEVFAWVCQEFMPDLIAFVSKKAAHYAWSSCPDMTIPSITTPHPACAWWNRTAKAYDGLRGRELLTNHLRDQAWLRPLS